MLEFENNNVSVHSMLTVIPTTEGPVNGYHVYVDTTANKNKKFDVPEGGIWIKDLNDEFQNKDNFVKGIKYVSEIADSEAMDTCFAILEHMASNYEDKTSEKYVASISFFCEIGVWENNKVRNPSFYDANFNQYLKNCMYPYLKLCY